MLSPKYQFIKKSFSKICENKFLKRKLVVFSQMILDIDNGFRFSYMPEENGEIEFLNALKNNHSDKFVYFDVGAHIGTYTDLILERFDAYQGYLFEPAPTTYQECIKRHGDNNSLDIHNLALADQISEMEYRIYADDPTRNGIAGVSAEGDMKTNIVKVNCTTGDQFYSDHKIKRINLLKIDAEGYDLHVIKGFDQILRDHAIDVIQFEYNVKHSETHSMLGDYYKFLTERGYHLGPLRQEGVKFSNFDFTMNDFNQGPNYIACLPEFVDVLKDF